MQIQSAHFQLSSPTLEACPDTGLPEVAFIGRSNVGKSSLINLLTGQKDLAKVSATPGKTKLINFFEINRAWNLVDLPGYGYAKVSQEKRGLFSIAIADYLEKRSELRHVFVLIDSRLPPQAIDLEFLVWLAARARPFSLIFTKADKLKSKALKQNTDAFLAKLSEVCLVEPDVLVTSTKERRGRAAVLERITHHLGGPTN
ncbi:MAG: ribosome biogenesis GTP-binding protein YihA/YsxC [Chthoniobacterales bacterium]